MLLDPSIVEEVKKRWKSYGGDVRDARDLASIGNTAARPADATVEFWKRRALAPSPDGTAFRTIPPTESLLIEGLGLPVDRRAERVLGTSDLLEVVFLEAALAVARTVARIRVNGTTGSLLGYGTGFLVSPRLLLTNWHVLKTETVAAIATAEFGYETRLGDGAARDGSIFRLRPDQFFLSQQDLDFALVAVEQTGTAGQSLDAYGFNKLVDDDVDLIVKGQFANIIQHPSGQPKQLAFRQNEVLEKPANFLHYRTDTAPGSSGAPVFNDQWQVVALHRAGVWATNAAGQILAVDNTVWRESIGEDRIKWLSNEGVRIPALLARWREQPSSLRGRELLEAVFAPGVPAVTERMKAEGAHLSQGVAATPGALAHPKPQGASDGPEIVDGVATWNIPLRISVSLGNLPGVTSSSTAPVVSELPAVAPAPTPAPAPAPDLATVLRRANEVLAAGRDDILRIRAGWQFDENGVTDKRALVVVVKRKRSPAELARAAITELPRTFEGYPVDVMGPSVEDVLRMELGPQRTESLLPGSVSPEEIKYHPPEGLSLKPVRGTMRVVAHVSPDAGWPVLSAFIADAREQLVGAMYEFTASHIRDALVTAASKPGFKKLTLVLDSTRGSAGNNPLTPDSEAMVRKMRETIDTKLETAWVKLGSVNGWVNHDYHIKVLVRDGEALWLSSGNWKDSGQPTRDPAGDEDALRTMLRKTNREWHAVIEHPGLAKTYRTAILGDFEANRDTRPEELGLPELYVESRPLPPAEEAREPVRYFAPFDERREFSVRPILTPDNYIDVVLDAVRGVSSALLIQNQSLATPTEKADPRYRELWETILAKQKRGFDVRLIFRIQDRDKAGSREMFEALKDFGLDAKRIKIQPGCHTKGMVIDGRHVLLGSHNLTNMGATTNRDASLLFDDVGLAAYFSALFEHDWEHVATSPTAASWRGGEIARAAGEAPEGFEPFDWKAWLEAR
ncbi:phospholipase D-like domain-containing protein [Bosea psychrotolerans]|uniref:Serine protease n=1 Tax=Bosea psychrotolerans TaxID=1871628 RepID=A0A2S4MBE4_9HYPH|nr:phospholipase D-like domain-containing protein [Bosea psychrotolerans]POR51939.1 phospholipase D-like protein [Bosea psychrotolerans]